MPPLLAVQSYILGVNIGDGLYGLLDEEKHWVIVHESSGRNVPVTPSILSLYGHYFSRLSERPNPQPNCPSADLSVGTNRLRTGYHF